MRVESLAAMNSEIRISARQKLAKIIEKNKYRKNLFIINNDEKELIILYNEKINLKVNRPNLQAHFIQCGKEQKIILVPVLLLSKSEDFLMA